MPNLSFLTFLEKFKYPPLAAFSGLLTGLALGWLAISAVYKEDFTIRDRARQDLERQLAESSQSSQAKDAEMARLREQLSQLSPQRQETEAKRRKELEALIQRLDKEIAQKKKELTAALPIYWPPAIFLTRCRPGEECNSQPAALAAPATPAAPRVKPAMQIQVEKELDSLVIQREEARKGSIQLISSSS